LAPPPAAASAGWAFAARWWERPTAGSARIRTVQMWARVG